MRGLLPAIGAVTIMLVLTLIYGAQSVELQKDSDEGAAEMHEKRPLNRDDDDV